MLKIINSVIYTLGKITVSGKENLDKLLACIRTLESLRDELLKAQTSPEVKDNGDGD